MSACWSLKSEDAAKLDLSCHTKVFKSSNTVLVRADKAPAPTAELCPEKLAPYNCCPKFKLEPRDAQLRPSSRSWFTAKEYATIYGIPPPSTSRNPVVGVVSFGGGLYGSVNSRGILTRGDCQTYWNYLGMTSHPVVKIVGVGGARNSPSGYGTDENTLDVQMIGACCPTSRLTIILYLVPNSLSNFVTIMDYILNTPVNVNGLNVKPGFISISWGAPEIYYSASLLNAIDSRFAQAAAAGIPVAAASGDYGSTNGVGIDSCDFPSSSPNLLACGGTNLICPNYIYDESTTETAWSSGGGAVSFHFAKPTYQNALAGTKRHTPDIALNADPATGVLFIVNQRYVVYGGTSVVSPAMAGYFAAIGCTQAPNHAIYAANPKSTYFNDISSGSNGGFTAIAGYDNCTGFGSIKGASLATLLGAPVVSVASVSVVAPQTNLNVGVSVQLTAIVLPIDAANRTVVWSTSDAAVATVSATGLVAGISAGSATITATTQDGGFTASVAIIVSNVVVLPTRITLSRASLNLARNTSFQLSATVSPSNATNKEVLWTTANSRIATVSSTGLIRALVRGTTRITATCAATNAVFARCTVYVY